VEGQSIATTVEKMARYFQSYGIRTKGHPLAWHTQSPQWLMEKSNAEVLDLLIGRIEREMGQFKSLVGMWDVINEMVIMPVFDKYDNAITRLCNHYGRVELAKILFDTARAADPTAQLLINDFNTTEEYAQLVAELLDAGVQIDAIGIQSHQHQGYWGDEKLARVLERFSRFDLPLHFSENTFISGQLMPPEIVDLNDHQVDAWPTTEEGEERQARDVERFYTHLFAHPKVEVITTWAFQDNAWLKAPAGMVRVDNSTKPAYWVLDDLINKQWKTNEQLITDENGVVEFKGFKGAYAVELNGKLHEVDSKTAVVTIQEM
jgi:endo-1,4-beta-xylanase